jgi:hypothetical protein
MDEAEVEGEGGPGFDAGFYAYARTHQLQVRNRQCTNYVLCPTQLLHSVVS